MPTNAPPQLTQQVVIRFAPQDRAEIERVARNEHRRPAEWVRLQALLALEAERERAAL